MKAHKPKIPRPKPKELRKIYKGLVTTSIALRIECLKTVLHWYDQALPYVESRVETDVERARMKDKMLKTRRLGIGSDKEHEQEAAFRACIKFAEMYCKILRPWPMDKVYAKYDLVAKRLESKQSRLEGKYGAFLQVLRALKPETVSGDTLRLTISDSQSGKKFGHKTNEFLYSRETAKTAQFIMRQKGVLPLVVEEIGALSRAAGQEKNAEGHFTLNHAKQVDAILKMLRNFISYCSNGNAPKRLIKTGHVVTDHVPRQRTHTGRSGGFGKGPKIDGLFVETSAVGILYKVLKDEQWHDKADLQKMVAVGLSSRLRGIKEKAAGMYQVEFDGEKVRMVKEVL